MNKSNWAAEDSFIGFNNKLVSEAEIKEAPQLFLNVCILSDYKGN